MENDLLGSQSPFNSFSIKGEIINEHAPLFLQFSPVSKIIKRLGIQLLCISTQTKRPSSREAQKGQIQFLVHLLKINTLLILQKKRPSSFHYPK